MGIDAGLTSALDMLSAHLGLPVATSPPGGLAHWAAFEDRD